MSRETTVYRKPAIIALGLTDTEKQYLTAESTVIDFEPLFAKFVGGVFETIITDKEHDIKGVLISLEDLYENKFFNIHEIISTIENCCIMVGKPKAYVRAFIRSENVDIKIVRDALKSEIHSIFYLPTSTHELRVQALRDYLDGKKFISSEIYELSKPKQEKRRKDPNYIELTPRQTQVLKLIRERGASNKVIARTLKLSESTVKLHVGSILKKYGLTNRTQLAVLTDPKPKNKDKESDPKIYEIKTSQIPAIDVLNYTINTSHDLPTNGFINTNVIFDSKLLESFTEVHIKR